MSFLTSAWDSLTGQTAREQERLTPEQVKAQKNAKYNERNTGSPTLALSWNEYGQQEFTSNLTGQTYQTKEEGIADEAALRNHTGRYAPGYANEAPVRAATGEQRTPGMGDQLGDQGIDFGASANAAMDRMSAPVTNPALAPGTRAPFTSGVVRPGFTDLLPSSLRATALGGTAPRRTVGSAPLAPSIFTQLPGAGTTPDDGPGAEAPDIHRDQIDRILGGLGGYENDFYAMSQDNTGLSEAEAQLSKAHLLATQRARDDLAANQAGALGAARGSRNRGDRALLERQAIGEQAYLGSQAQRQQKNLDDQIPLDMAILRAKEEDADRTFRFQALGKAADLGLNTAALEVDIAKTNLDSATNWVNNEFQQLGVDKQINNDEAKNLLGFTRDMAAIQYEYDKLGVDDQNVADQLLLQKYGIDQQTMVALKKIKEDGKFQWDQVLTAFAGGVATGGTAGVANLIGGGDSGGTSS